jgi:AraC-like DNA-binding protein
MPPITFLRHKQRGDVHSILLRGGPDVMIREIAVAHGFVDLSRFNQEYRKLFGELPSPCALGQCWLR